MNPVASLSKPIRYGTTSTEYNMRTATNRSHSTFRTELGGMMPLFHSCRTSSTTISVPCAFAGNEAFPSGTMATSGTTAADVVLLVVLKLTLFLLLRTANEVVLAFSRVAVGLRARVIAVTLSCLTNLLLTDGVIWPRSLSFSKKSAVESDLRCAEGIRALIFCFKRSSNASRA